MLDVGCYEAPLRHFVGKDLYHGIDFAGDPDQHIDLEKAERLPFEDNAYPTVICIEVLEHLDNLHAMFSELCRVSSSHVIVSLPNCWAVARRHIERGRGKISHYGLPHERPPDRHKWFFNCSEIISFFEAASTSSCALERVLLIEKPRSTLSRTFRHLVYSEECYTNRYTQTVLAVFKKT
ncbi:MAG: class I SAM-dependent methyltransferase [Verrucomicrobiota bacterium]